MELSIINGIYKTIIGGIINMSGHPTITSGSLIYVSPTFNAMARIARTFIKIIQYKNMIILRLFKGLPPLPFLLATPIHADQKSQKSSSSSVFYLLLHICNRILQTHKNKDDTRCSSLYCSIG